MTYIDMASDIERYGVFSLEPQYFLSDDSLKISDEKKSFRGTVSAENSWCIDALRNLVNDYSMVVTIDQGRVYARIFTESSPVPTNMEFDAMTELNRGAIRLIDRWLADGSDYDTRNWEKIKNSIERNRLSTRDRFVD
jgi:hypothetical protein